MQRDLRDHEDDRTGLDLPISDGQVSDDDVEAIDTDRKGEGGQDHSLDNYAENTPSEGVGAIQDRSDTSSDIYHED